MKDLAASARRWFLWRSGLAGRLPFQSVILMYHRFCPTENENGLARQHFAGQLDYLQRHYTVSSLAEALAADPAGGPRVAITVDDGYRSFYEHAWPELEARGLTAAVFLPSEFIDSGGWMWQDRNIYLLRNARSARYQLNWQGEQIPLDVRTPRGLMAALLRVYEICRQLDPDGRLQISQQLSRDLDLPLPDAPPPIYAPMNWDQVRELQAQGVTFGSHTVNHAILTTCGHAVARQEIEGSKAILAERLGVDVHGFAYPNGNYDDEIHAMTRRAGYDFSLAIYAGYWSTRGDRHAVPRLPAPNGGEAVLADRLWCWWRRFGAPERQFASTSP